MNKKIYAFWRACVRSDRPSEHNGKQRPEGFTLKKAFWNFLSNTNTYRQYVEITVMLDGEYKGSFYEELANEHGKKDLFKVVPINAGSDKKSFLITLEYIEQLNLQSKDIIYLVEDDFLHKENWPAYIFDGIENTPCEYVTLYDHPDKYFLPMYRTLESTLFLGKLTHWRTTPSTTNTFACTWETLKHDMPIHKRVCNSNCNIEDKQIPFTYDHLRFVELAKAGSTLVSAIPGRSTNSEPAYLSPFTDWSRV